MLSQQKTPQEKYVSFRRAFDTVKAHETNGNFIGAFVVAFSLLEDRIGALYTMTKAHRGEPIAKENTSFGAKVSYLARNNELTADLRDECLRLARERNKKLHAAMWRLDEFQSGDSNRIVNAARHADRGCKLAKGRRSET